MLTLDVLQSREVILKKNESTSYGSIYPALGGRSEFGVVGFGL